MTFFDYVSLAAEVEVEDETRQGSTGHGLSVDCFPDPNDMMVVERRNRTVCLARPYPMCSVCPHSTFTLIFRSKEERLEQVSCPRWESEAARMSGQAPREYVTTEVATCRDAPFEFCRSCPTCANVARSGADKKVAGWYGRWNRLNQEEHEDG